ncbi:MAG TPA: Uma2 family endonuclease [Nocardioides sp.]
MEAVTTLPRGRALTVADLESMPDDGHRYELIDGTLLVTPGPSLRHQTVSMELSVLLSQACPPHLKALAAPFDVVLDDQTGVQPDLLVAGRGAFTENNLPTAPLLAIEILSPSTRLVDLNLKKAAYERAGVASYWVVDPVEPRLIAWQLQSGVYERVADVEGDESWTAASPYAVTVVPSALLG